MSFILTKKKTCLILFGNVLEHFDKALYRLAAPFIAFLFYPKFHPVTTLILAYIPVSFIFRPLGAVFFGRYGDQLGRQKALYLSIIGMSIMIIAVGLTPTYKTAGIFSALLLHFFRGMICFFAAGEGTAATLSLIENAPEKERNLFSSYYEMSSMLGIVLASLLIGWMVRADQVTQCWRWLFIFSGLFGLVVFWMRKRELQFEKVQPLKPLQVKGYLVEILTIISLTGFSYANYAILSALMNGYVPLVSSLSSSSMMTIHSWLVCYDFLFLPVFGLLAKKYGAQRMIVSALLMALLFSYPLFFLLNTPSFLNVLILRMTLVTWGIMLAAPLGSWIMTVTPKPQRFRMMAISKAIGSQCIGAPAISICLWLYRETGWVAIPSIYLIVCSAVSLLLLFIMSYYRKRVVFRYPSVA